MNLSKPLSSPSRIIRSILTCARLHLPRQRSLTFGGHSDALGLGIGPVFVINLDRQTSRWTDAVRELGRILDAHGAPLSDRIATHRPILQKFSMALWFNRFIRLVTSYSSSRNPMQPPMCF